MLSRASVETTYDVLRRSNLDQQRVMQLSGSHVVGFSDAADKCCQPGAPRIALHP